MVTFIPNSFCQCWFGSGAAACAPAAADQPATLPPLHLPRHSMVVVDLRQPAARRLLIPVNGFDLACRTAPASRYVWLVPA